MLNTQRKERDKTNGELRLGRLPGIYPLQLWNELRSGHVSLASTAGCCTNLDVDFYREPARDDGGDTNKHESTRESRLVNGQVTQ